MTADLTAAEKLAPSKRLADNLEYFKNRAEDKSSLNQCEEACVAASAAHSRFCVETALTLLGSMMQYAERPALSTLTSIKGYLESAVDEGKDAAFVLDGYYDWYKQNKEWEEEVSEDLDTCGYAGKWKSAKEGVTRDQPNISGSAYWDAVRTYFLELGGCYLSERCEHSTAEDGPNWQVAISQAVATRPAEPFTQVRQG